jgi:murein DD-endopeptidase MepM/ murein hydrolase activator NlpD
MESPAFQLLRPVTWSHLIRARFDDPVNYSGQPTKIQRREGMLFVPQGVTQPLEVRAVQRGIVQEIRFFAGGYGNFVLLRHEWYGDTYISWYGHLERATVKQGDWLNAGDVIGIAGRSGSATEVCLFLTLQHIGEGRKNYVVDDVINPELMMVDTLSPRDEAQFDADVTIPDGVVMKPGQIFKKTWRVRNTGNTTWGEGYQLAFHSGDPFGRGASGRAPAAKPGELVLASVEMTAPQNTGDVKSTWMLRNPRGDFFPHELYTLIKVQGQGQGQPATQISLARFVRDVTIPDGALVKPGEQFVKTWRIRNSGSTTWGAGYELVFYKDNQMGAGNSVPLPALLPNQEGNVSITLTAPTTLGLHRTTWKPRDPSGLSFDFEMYAEIEVGVPDSQLNTKPLFDSPVRGSYYIGWRYLVPVPYLDGTHKGVDYVSNGRVTGLPIFAGGNGLVTLANLCTPCSAALPNFNAHGLSQAQRNAAFNDPVWNYGFGHLVVVRYSWKDISVTGREAMRQAGCEGWNAYVFYAHLHQIFVSRGQSVRDGVQIGTMGDTGNSTAPHLHLEIRCSRDTNGATNYRRIDPLRMFRE